MKRLACAFLAGMLTVLGLAYHAGPDAIVQTGLRLAALQTSYDFVASPREQYPVSYSTKDLLAYEVPSTPKKKGGR